MKYLLLATVTLLSSPAAHAANYQKFQRTVITHWTLGPGDWANLNKHDRCNEAEQAFARIGAQDRAIQDCEASPGVRECLVKSSRVTVNGRLPEDLLLRYGMENYDLYSAYGCEGSALVYGLTE